LRGIAAGRKAGEVPEWKKETFNKATSFGKVTSLSIQEQRQGLPIYQMRSMLIKAISEVCIRLIIKSIVFFFFWTNSIEQIEEY